MKITICGQDYTEADVPLQAAKEALQCQDACNLGGVVFALARHTQALCDNPRKSGTAWKNHHPVIVLFLNKCSSLCTGDLGDTQAFSVAYDLCCAVVDKGE